MATKQELIVIVEEFIERVRDIAALYSDATFGFGCYRTFTIDGQKNSAEFYRQRGISRTQEEIENQPIISTVPTATHIDSTGTHYGAAALHSSSSKQIIERNDNLGSNEKRLSQLTIVMLYSLWEHSTRPKIEKLLGKKIQIDIFSELAHLRHCILKNAGKVSGTAHKKLSVFKFKENEEVFLTGGDLVQLLQVIGNEVSRFVNDSFRPQTP